jgi:DNA polymerase II large subunit
MMDIQSIRRARLAQLITEKYDGSQAKFIEETGENQGEVSALLKSKSFGEKKARKLEIKCKLPSGWLDEEIVTLTAKDQRIAHALRIMQEMDEAQLDMAVKIIDTIAKPDDNPGNNQKAG